MKCNSSKDLKGPANSCYFTSASALNESDDLSNYSLTSFNCDSKKKASL